MLTPYLSIFDKNLEHKTVLPTILLEYINNKYSFIFQIFKKKRHFIKNNINNT